MSVHQSVRLPRWAALLIVATVALLAASAFTRATPDAAAAATHYCGQLVPPQSRCADWRYFSFGAYYNSADYGGNYGQISVCQHVYLGYGTGGGTASRTCGINHADSGSDLYYYYNLSDDMSLFVGNNSTNNHTILGLGES